MNIQSITVRPSSEEQTQVVNLDHTIVTGFIQFEKPGGRVHMKNGSSLGDIINGSVIQT